MPAAPAEPKQEGAVEAQLQNSLKWLRQQQMGVADGDADKSLAGKDKPSGEGGGISLASPAAPHTSSSLSLASPRGLAGLYYSSGGTGPRIRPRAQVQAHTASS